MKYIDFYTHFKNFPVISLTDMRKFNTLFDSRRLFEWSNKGYIQQIKNGLYEFCDKDTEYSEDNLYIIANNLYKTSYVSLESCLSYYGIIPESVYSITSICSEKTVNYLKGAASYIYHKIKPELIFGYGLRMYKGFYYRFADLEKSLLDYMYIHPKIKSFDDFEGVRINVYECQKIDREKLKGYLTLFKNKSLEKRVNRLLTYIDKNI